MKNWFHQTVSAPFVSEWRSAAGAAIASRVKILNAAYLITREFCQSFNQASPADWKGKTADNLTVSQFHSDFSLIAQSGRVFGGKFFVPNRKAQF